jgi:hypothetical protein
MDIAVVESTCVTNFPLSNSRSGIMSGLKAFIDRLVTESVEGELWINGSFLTEEIDPKDCDVVLRTHGLLYDNGTTEYRAAIDWVIANQKNTLSCDSYVLFEYSPGDPLYTEWEWWYSYWHAKWGFSREEDPKGIAVISLTNSAAP